MTQSPKLPDILIRLAELAPERVRVSAHFSLDNAVREITGRKK